MKEILYKLVGFVALIHNYLMKLNDKFEYNFSDKELHFLVIGVIGLLMVFVIYPFFKWLAKKNHVMIISWIYVFTLIIVITFAIEIGQKISNTGNMEFADIMFGVLGFLVMFFIFACIREVYHLIKKFLNYIKNGKKENAVVVEESEDTVTVTFSKKALNEKSETIQKADNAEKSDGTYAADYKAGDEETMDSEDGYEEAAELEPECINEADMYTENVNTEVKDRVKNNRKTVFDDYRESVDYRGNSVLDDTQVFIHPKEPAPPQKSQNMDIMTDDEIANEVMEIVKSEADENGWSPIDQN